MRVFKTKPFARFADHEGITDAELWDAIRRAEDGQVDADWAAASSSSVLPGKDRVDRAAFGASCFFGKDRRHSSSTASPRVIGTPFAGTS
jgi:hypothetical protein